MALHLLIAETTSAEAQIAATLCFPPTDRRSGSPTANVRFRRFPLEPACPQTATVCGAECTNICPGPLGGGSVTFGPGYISPRRDGAQSGFTPSTFLELSPKAAERTWPLPPRRPSIAQAGLQTATKHLNGGWYGRCHVEAHE